MTMHDHDESGRPFQPGGTASSDPIATAVATAVSRRAGAALTPERRRGLEARLRAEHAAGPAAPRLPRRRLWAATVASAATITVAMLVVSAWWPGDAQPPADQMRPVGPIEPATDAAEESAESWPELLLPPVPPPETDPTTPAEAAAHLIAALRCADVDRFRRLVIRDLRMAARISPARFTGRVVDAVEPAADATDAAVTVRWAIPVDAPGDAVAAADMVLRFVREDDAWRLLEPIDQLPARADPGRSLPRSLHARAVRRWVIDTAVTGLDAPTLARWRLRISPAGEIEIADPGSEPPARARLRTIGTLDAVTWSAAGWDEPVGIDGGGTVRFLRTRHGISLALRGASLPPALADVPATPAGVVTLPLIPGDQRAVVESFVRAATCQARRHAAQQLLLGAFRARSPRDDPPHQPADAVDRRRVALARAAGLAGSVLAAGLGLRKPVATPHRRRPALRCRRRQACPGAPARLRDRAGRRDSGPRAPDRKSLPLRR
jgi:hypothetical protein